MFQGMPLQAAGKHASCPCLMRLEDLRGLRLLCVLCRRSAVSPVRVSLISYVKIVRRRLWLGRVTSAEVGATASASVTILLSIPHVVLISAFTLALLFSYNYLTYIHRS